MKPWNHGVTASNHLRLRYFRINLWHDIGVRVIRVRSGNRVQRIRVGIRGRQLRFWILHYDHSFTLLDV